MVLTQQLTGTITSNTGSGTQNDPVIVQGKNVDVTGEINELGATQATLGSVRIIVEPGTKGTLYVKFQGDGNTIIQRRENGDNSTVKSEVNPSGEYERTYVDVNEVYIAFLFYPGLTEHPFTVEYYHSAQSSNGYPTLNWQVRRPRYSNNALVFYKSGTASGAVGSVVNSRAVSRRT